jgi:hypothetical protein
MARGGCLINHDVKGVIAKGCDRKKSKIGLEKKGINLLK